MKNYRFIFILVLSLIIRIYLAVFTEGTYDVEIWKDHAEKISSVGMFQYYKDSYNTERQFNHPPVIGYTVTLIYKLSQALNIPFKAAFRMPFALLDFLCAYFIFLHFRDSRYRKIFVSLYLLCPAVFILSSYHGNTDSLLGLFIIISLYFLTKNDFLKAGIFIGIGACVKWIIIIVLPVYFFSKCDLRKKIKLVSGFSITFLLGYLFFLIHDFDAVANGVFKYSGQLIQSTKGIPIWGNIIFYSLLGNLYTHYLSFPSAETLNNGLIFILENNRIIIIAAIILYSFFTRNREMPDTGKRLGEMFFLFYALTNFFAFQYFAWALPCFLFLRWNALIPAYILISGYLYSLYYTLTGSFLLKGNWDLSVILYFLQHSLFSGISLFFFSLVMGQYILFTRLEKNTKMILAHC